MGHRGAALLPGPERLHELPDLGVLEVPDLGREALERPAGDRDRRHDRPDKPHPHDHDDFLAALAVEGGGGFVEKYQTCVQ